MNKICKIGIETAAAVGAACVTSLAVDKLRRKWFNHGYDAGEFAGFVGSSEIFAEKQTVLRDKYSKLSEDYAELERAYNELCAETDNE